MGQLIQLLKIQKEENELDMTSLSKGVYFLMFENGTVKRVLKQ